MKQLILLMFIMIFSKGVTQVMNKNYMLFDTDLDNRSEFIEFLNDSTLRRQPYFSKNYCLFGQADVISIELSKSKYKEYKYKKRNDTITLLKFNDCNNISFKLIEDKYFVNSEKKLIYALRDEYDDLPRVVVNYKNKFYEMDSPKISRIINRKRVTNLEVNIYHEFDAFEKFGFDYLFGVMEIKKKK